MGEMIKRSRYTTKILMHNDDDDDDLIMKGIYTVILLRLK